MPFLSIYVLWYGAMFMCGVCLIMILHDMYTVAARIELSLDHTLFIGTHSCKLRCISFQCSILVCCDDDCLCDVGIHLGGLIMEICKQNSF
jgi:hypothetical protein